MIYNTIILTILVISYTYSLRIVQYNAEWLFLNYYEPMDCPGNGCPWKNASHAQSHLELFSSQLDQLNGDIINICEVEGIYELDAVIEKMSNLNYKSYLVEGTDTGTGQNVGLISKVPPKTDLWRSNATAIYPIEGSTCGYTGEYKSTSVSKHYITTFDILINGSMTILTVIGAHLIAVPTDPERCAKREAQASILQEFIYNAIVLEKTDVLVIGDFNDFDGTTLDLNNNIPLSSTLDILKGDAGKYKGKYSLTNLAENLPSEERYSDWWDSDDNCTTASINDYSMIDHMLVTPNIEKNVESMFINHNYVEYCGKLNSDHYPVVIDLDI